MTSKTAFKLTFATLVIGFSLSASMAAFAQYTPNIHNNAGNGMMDNAAPYNPAPYNPVAATGTGYTNDGTLMMGGQKIGNPHQILHDLNVPSFFGVNANRLTFTDNPSYGSGTLAQMENHTLNIGVPAGNVVLSRLYLTPTNPYTEGVATPHNNYQTYQGVVADAQAGSYQLTVANDSKLYAFKTLGSMSTQSQNILIKELPAHSVFIANSDPKGGATAVRVTQSGDYAAMQNYFDTVKPYDFSWRSALAPYANDPNMAGATGAFFTNWVLGSDQVKAYQANLQNQSAGSGNEAFGVLAWDANQNRYVMLDPTNTKATAGSVSGNMPTLGANQFGFFGMHTHAGSSTPSGQDLRMTQQLGLDQLVIGNNGTAAIFANNAGNQWQGAGFKFHLLPEDHRRAAVEAALRAGYTTDQAKKFGQDVVDVDIGTQTTSPQHSVMHNMRGIDPATGKPITQEQFLELRGEYLLNATLEQLGHLTTGDEVKHHFGEPWYGTDKLAEMAVHGLQDLLAGITGNEDRVLATLALIQERRERDLLNKQYDEDFRDPVSDIEALVRSEIADGTLNTKDTTDYSGNPLGLSTGDDGENSSGNVGGNW